jgi:hypothetical protein
LRIAGVRAPKPVKSVRKRTRPAPPTKPLSPGEQERERRREAQREYRRSSKEHDERYDRLLGVAEQLGLELFRDYPFRRNSGLILAFPGARQALWRCSDLDRVEAFLNNEPSEQERFFARHAELDIAEGKEGGLSAETHQRVRKKRLDAWAKIEKRRSRSRQ